MAQGPQAYIFWPPDDVGALAGFLKFDVVTSEQHEMANVITSHPVEKGSDITDHVRPTPDGITLEVFVSNAPTDDVMNRGSSKDAVPLDVPKYEPPFALTPGAAFGAASGALQSAVSGLFGFKDDGINAPVLQFSSTFDAVAEVYGTLQSLRDTAQLLTITTRVRDYAGFVIENVSMPRTSEDGDGASLTIAFRQIRIVESKLVKAPVPTEARGKVPKNKGAIGTKDAGNAGPKRSALHKALHGGG